MRIGVCNFCLCILECRAGSLIAFDEFVIFFLKFFCAALCFAIFLT